LSKIQADATASQVVRSHPVVKVARQVYSFSFVQQASPMFFIQEFCHEVVAHHRHEITVAHRRILNLRNVDFLLLFAFLIFFPFFTHLLSYPLLLLLLLLLLLKFTKDLIICLVDACFHPTFMPFNPSVLVDALAIQNDKPHNSPVIRLINSFAYFS
jgi:hypothetical protein